MLGLFHHVNLAIPMIGKMIKNGVVFFISCWYILDIFCLLMCLIRSRIRIEQTGVTQAE